MGYVVLWLWYAIRGVGECEVVERGGRCKVGVVILGSPCLCTSSLWYSSPWGLYHVVGHVLELPVLVYRLFIVLLSLFSVSSSPCSSPSTSPSTSVSRSPLVPSSGVGSSCGDRVQCGLGGSEWVRSSTSTTCTHRCRGYCNRCIPSPHSSRMCEAGG